MSLAGLIKTLVMTWTSVWFGACACEPPEAFVASIAGRLAAVHDLEVKAAEINRFWAYRPSCGRRRCTSSSAPLTHGQIALLLPIGERPRIHVM